VPPSPAVLRRALRAGIAIQWLGLAMLAACQAEPARAPTSSVAPAPAPPAFGDGARLVSSAAQGVDFVLPGAASWRILDDPQRGLVASHATTESRLFVRVWRPDALTRRQSCETQARALFVDLPARAPEPIEQRRLALAKDFELALEANVEPAPAGLAGYALAFGGDGRHCLAVVFSTLASGARAEHVLAERLGIIIESVFARMRLRSIDDRVYRPQL
jgi:hypothetical protein